MIEIFIIGLLAGAGINLKFTGTYFHTKKSKIAVIIPLSKKKSLHLHHWFLSLISILVLFILMHYYPYLSESSSIMLLLGFLIATCSQGIFLKNAFSFIDLR